MSVKKISLNLTEANYDKLVEAVEKSGISKTEFINKAIAEVPIIILGDRKMLAECFFDLRRMMLDDDYEGFGKGVSEVCQSLNMVMEKIEEVTR